MSTSLPIVGDWVHAHEEDRGRVQVFVNSKTVLPPSRGRRRFSFRGNGEFDEAQPGSDDRINDIAGTYLFDGQHLTLNRAKRGALPTVFKVALGESGTRLELIRQDT